jgi:hypothetical protein
LGVQKQKKQQLLFNFLYIFIYTFLFIHFYLYIFIFTLIHMCKNKIELLFHKLYNQHKTYITHYFIKNDEYFTDSIGL